MILGAGCHAELNRRIRRAAEMSKGIGFVRSDDRPRLLLGEHDATAFAQATAHSFHGRIALEYANQLHDHRQAF